MQPAVTRLPAQSFFLDGLKRMKSGSIGGPFHGEIGSVQNRNARSGTAPAVLTGQGRVRDGKYGVFRRDSNDPAGQTAAIGKSRLSNDVSQIVKAVETQSESGLNAQPQQETMKAGSILLDR